MLYLIFLLIASEPADVVNLAGAPCTRCPSDAMQCSDNLCGKPIEMFTIFHLFVLQQLLHASLVCFHCVNNLTCLFQYVNDLSVHFIVMCLHNCVNTSLCTVVRTFNCCNNNIITVLS